MIGNTAPHRKAGARPFKPGDFVPKVERPVRNPKAFRQQFLADFGHRIVPAKKKGKDGG